MSGTHSNILTVSDYTAACLFPEMRLIPNRAISIRELALCHLVLTLFAVRIEEMKLRHSRHFIAMVGELNFTRAIQVARSPLVRLSNASLSPPK